MFAFPHSLGHMQTYLPLKLASTGAYDPIETALSAIPQAGAGNQCGDHGQ
jgi:hypothetical protein